MIFYLGIFLLIILLWNEFYFTRHLTNKFQKYLKDRSKQAKKLISDLISRMKSSRWKSWKTSTTSQWSVSSLKERLCSFCVVRASWTLLQWTKVKTIALHLLLLIKHLMTSISITIDMVLGMRYIQRYNYMHSDLKPSNILQSKYGQVYISDFGLAKEENLEIS